MTAFFNRLLTAHGNFNLDRFKVVTPEKNSKFPRINPVVSIAF
jgi:hypothetical protein